MSDRESLCDARSQGSYDRAVRLLDQWFDGLDEHRSTPKWRWRARAKIRRRLDVLERAMDRA